MHVIIIKWWMIELFKTISFCAISWEINQRNVYCFTRNSTQTEPLWLRPMAWERSKHYWSFPLWGPLCGALIFSSMLAWTSYWTKSRVDSWCALMPMLRHRYAQRHLWGLNKIGALWCQCNVGNVCHLEYAKYYEVPTNWVQNKPRIIIMPTVLPVLINLVLGKFSIFSVYILCELQNIQHIWIQIRQTFKIFLDITFLFSSISFVVLHKMPDNLQTIL